VSVFEWNGTQYLAFAAGGNSLAATAHGDNLWLFSLDGTMGPAAPAGEGEGEGHAGEVSPEEPDEGGGEADAEAGESVWSDNCAGCHGLAGTGANGGPDITSANDFEAVLEQVRNGGGGMPAFQGTLSAKQIRDVSAWVTEEIAGGG
jgi:alcohol dehydrogenase (cytochrome c)